MPEPTPLPERAKRRAKQVVRRVAGKQIVERRRRALTPELTVVMPVYNVAEYLPEALDSVLSQNVGLELIAVDDSSTDECLQILRDYERRDPRVKVFTQPNSGQGVARNLAVGHARGEFLTFVDSDDTIPPGSFAHMIARLRESGSDFCVGNVRRFKHQHYTRTVWARTVHSRDRLGTTLEEFPNAMQDIIACNRMFRTAFWRSDVGDFRGHIAYEDHVPMLTAYVRAKRFDILAQVTYNWRIRENRTSTGQQKANLENLLDRIAVKEEAHDLLTAEASDFVYDTWVGRTLEVDFPPFVRHAVTGPDSYRNILAATYRTYLDRATPRALDQVTVRQKVRGHLAAQARWDDVTQADTWFEDVGLTPPAHAEDGPDGRQVMADEQPDQPFLQGLPDVVRRLSPLECHFHGVLSRVAWGPSYAAASTVQLTGWAVRRGLGVRSPATLRAWLVEGGTGEEGGTIRLPVESVNLPEANVWGQQRFAPYDGGGFEVTVDCSTLPARAASWHLVVETTYDGVTSAGPIVERMPRGSAHRQSGTVVELDGRIAAVRTRWDAGHGFTLDVDPDPVTVESLVVGSSAVDAGIASGVLVVPQGREVRGVELRNPHRPPAPATTSRAGGRLTFEVPVPVGSDAPQQERSWNLVVLGAGRPAAPIWAGGDAGDAGRGDAGPQSWIPSLALGPVLAVASPVFEVTGVELGDETLTFRVDRGAGVTDEQLASVRLGNPRVTLDRLRGERPDELTFSLQHETVTGARTAVPSARYELTLPLPQGALTATVSGDLSGDLPRFDHGSLVDLEVGQTADGRLTLSVEPPLPPEARGISGRRRLRDEFRAMDVTPADAVAFACYRGEFATDSQLALDRGFARLRPEVTRYWGVLDASTEVPEGAVPLLLDSREWYAALASSRWVSNNIDFGLWFTARPHQRYLQTFHGYPFKSMGIEHWRSKGLNEEAIAQELVKVNREWDTILVPSEECSSFYREQYAWQGEILVAGYPRCDALVAGSPWAADAGAVRERVLGRLGVPLEKQVVLYAPTYRDSLTTRTFAARRFDELELAGLVRSLGDEYVVLLRGHNNNQRELDRVHGVNRVVDVTDWPDVNELTLAADVAVLDYSSLRFDWALTGKPMVFFVPDLEDYFAEREPLFPYAGTAPGPWARTTDEVAEALADLPGLRASFAGEIAAFNDRFNGLHDGHATDRVLEWFLS